MKIALTFIISAIVALFAFSLIAQNAERTVQLTWAAPVTRTDGAVLPTNEILGYEIDCTTGETASVGSVLTYQFSTSNFGEHSCSIVALATGNDAGDILRADPVSTNFTITPPKSRPSPVSNFSGSTI